METVSVPIVKTWHIVAILSLPVIFGVLWVCSIPPGHGPDEEAHLAYIRVVREKGGLPLLSFSTEGSWSEGHQPPFFYVTAAVVSVLLGPEWGLRWFSLILGIGSILAYYGLACKLFPGHRLTAAAMAATAGVLPMFSFLTATVNNGAMVQFFVAVVLYLGVSPVRWKGWQSVAMGLLIGAAVLSKLSGLFLIPFFVVAWGRQWTEKELTFNNFIRLTGRLMVILILFTGWWFWRNWLLYGDIFGWQQQMASATALVRRVRLTPDYLYAVTVEIWRSFWAAFGPAARSTAAPSVYILIACVVSPGIAGVVASRWSDRTGRIAGAILGGGMISFLGWPLAVPWFSTISHHAGGLAVKVLLSLILAAGFYRFLSIRWYPPQVIRRETGLLALAVFFLLLGVYRYNIDFPQPQGRFLMPCVAQIVYLTQIGWMAILGWHKRWIPLVGGLVLAIAGNCIALISYA